MTKKIFQSILLVAGCVLLASLLIIMGFLYDYFGGVEENQLRDELSLAAAAVEDGGTDYLSQLTADRYRLTWIATDGSVLYDTRTDAESLENHASRAEVKDSEANITLRIISQLISATYDKAGALVDGDAETVAEVNDLWTFARDIRSRDPNWKLIATESEN